MTEITELISQENNELCNYEVDQTVICNKNYLPFIYRESLKPEERVLKKLDKTYVKPTIYYPYTEDLDYKSRFKQLLNNNEYHKVSDECKPFDFHTEEEAETQYLSSNPVSFLIIGKPEIGQTHLAKLLSEQWKCVYISPDSVIEEEIMSSSRAGKCIEYNLRSGRGIGPEVILRLVEKRVRSQTAQHRGFVISGFPMLPNIYYKTDPISSESAVFNVQEIFEELLLIEHVPSKPGSVSLAEEKSVTESKSVIEEETIKKENQNIKLEDDLDFGPSDLAIITATESFHELYKPEVQINFLSNLFKQPFVIIYTMCSNLDVINKREKYRFDIYNAYEINLQNDSVDPTRVRFEDEEEFLDGNQMKQVVKLPAHFPKCVSSQLRFFRCFVHKSLESMVLDHNPEYFMKVDGRLPPGRMFENVWMRLKMLGFQPVLIPEKLVEEEIATEFAGEAPLNMFRAMSPEVAFQQLRGRLTIAPMYKLQLSDWVYKCPVALKEGRIVQGNPELAVKFMNKIFFLSDQECLLKFYRNPRFYLQPICPQPTCRIWIMGPPLSGKTVVAKCLSILFECCILVPEDLEKAYEAKKKAEYIEKIRTAAITDALLTLNKLRKIEHETKILEWKDKACELMLQAINYKSKSESFEGEELPPHFKIKTEIEIRNELRVMKLPAITDTKLINDLLSNNEELMKYVPVKLTEPFKPATVFDAFVTDYVNDVINNIEIPDMSLTRDDKIDMYRTAIQSAEDEYYTRFKIHGGWIIDSMFPDLEFIELLGIECIADDLICLKDEPENLYLQEIYAKKNYYSFKNFRQLFTDMKKDSVAERTQSFISSSSRIDFINNVIKGIESKVGSENEIELPEISSNEDFLNKVNNFDNNWIKVKDYLNKIKNDSVIEMNISYKPMENLLKEIILTLEDKYRLTASVMTEQERSQEMSDFSGTGNLFDEEQDFGEGEPTDLIEFFKQNRRLGDTNIYCPVAFERYFVLWKGKEEFTAQFKHKSYLFSSESVMNEFVANPRFYLKNFPPKRFPPPRVCIIGVSGSGKTTLAKRLADNFGLFYLNFDSIVLKAFNLFLNETIEDVLTIEFEENEEEEAKLKLNPEELENLRNYIENDISLPDDLILKLMSRYWFEEPYANIGFVLDNFPRRPSDIKIMISNYIIPDLVIELHAPQKIVHERIFSLKFNKWKEFITEKQELKKLENEEVLNKWQLERFERMRILSYQKERERRFGDMEQQKRLLTTPIDSNIDLDKIDQISEEILFGEDWFYDPVLRQEDMDEINQLLDAEMPEPQFNDVWESDEEATTRIETGIDNNFTRDLEFLNTIRKDLKDGNIDCTLIDTSKKLPEKVLYEIIRLTDSYKFRNRSLFERVYEIPIEIAERLLNEGYYFLSKFGRICPVQFYEKINPFQMFSLAEQQFTIFPFIHRRYIYFVYGLKSRDKFKNDPLKYVNNKNCAFPLIPIRIAVIGPPKCGKSYLAERFEKEFHVKALTRGKAIRYILKQIPNCELARNIQVILDKGWSLTYEMVAKCVEALTLDGRCLSQGFVLDGFPNSKEEMLHFIKLGIVPHIFLDIQINLIKIKELSTLNPFPNPNQLSYSYKFIKHKYGVWKRNAQSFRTWLYNEYENLYLILNDDSKWHLWVQAKENVFKTWKKFQKYLLDKNYDQALSLKSLCITPFEFYERQSLFKNYCPLCFYYDDVLNQSGKYPDRNALVQYKSYLFYICQKHLDLFISDPKSYIPPNNVKLLPENLPVIINDEIESLPYEEGFCIVSFWDNQPKRILQKGDTNFTVRYKGVYYLFCSNECLNEFMRTPLKYYDKVIHFKDRNPLELCDLHKMPVLGYLEQYVANLIIQAVIHTEVRRPFIPGVSVEISTALNLGLYLKLNNPKLPKEIKPIYDEAIYAFEERRTKFKELLAYFKNRVNPFLCLDDYKLLWKRYLESYRGKSSEFFVDVLYKRLELDSWLSYLEMNYGGEDQ